MTNRVRLTLVVLFAVGCGAAVLSGTREPSVNFASVLEIWGDVLRDTDQIGLRMTRVTDAEEMQFGRDLAAACPWPPAADASWQAYVQDVGLTLSPFARRSGVRYEFHVIEWNAPNACAIAGGHVYISTAMLALLESEAELAAILGHEISHVDLRHCVERYQYALKLRKSPAALAGHLVDMFRTLASAEYRKFQEQEADAQGVRLAAEAGYNPEAAARVFRRLDLRAARPAPGAAKSPVAESARAAGEALGDYFRSHPRPADRAARLGEQIRRYQAPGTTASAWYEGRENYQRRVARSRQGFHR
jgi:predicted Zn-dependent protease